MRFSAVPRTQKYEYILPALQCCQLPADLILYRTRTVVSYRAPRKLLLWRPVSQIKMKDIIIYYGIIHWTFGSMRIPSIDNDAMTMATPRETFQDFQHTGPAAAAEAGGA